MTVTGEIAKMVFHGRSERLTPCVLVVYTLQVRYCKVAEAFGRTGRRRHLLATLSRVHSDAFSPDFSLSNVDYQLPAGPSSRIE